MTWVLWYRPCKLPGMGRRRWEAVAECKSERECTDAMHASGLRNGQWLTLPKGKRP